MNDKWDYPLGYPEEPPQGPWRPKRSVDRAALSLGCFGTLVLVVVGIVIAANTTPAISLTLGALLAGVGVWLVTRRQPVPRGLGVGILITLALGMLLIGMCVEMARSIG